MKKLFFLLLSTVLVLPSLASAQIQGSIPGSADPKWTCQMSARAVYMNASTNKIEYSATYGLTGDFGTSVSFITRIIQENAPPVMSSKNVQLSPTNGQNRPVTIAGKTVFTSEVSIGNGRPITINTSLGDVSCGSVTLNLVRQAGAPLAFSSSLLNKEPKITNPNGIQTPQPNFGLPAQDPDDAPVQPLNPTANTIPEPNIAGQNVSDRFSPPPPGGQNSADAEASNNAPEAVVTANSVNPSQEILENGRVTDEELTQGVINNSDEPTERESSNPEQRSSFQENFVMFLVSGIIAVLLSIVLFLLLKKT